MTKDHFGRETAENTEVMDTRKWVKLETLFQFHVAWFTIVISFSLRMRQPLASQLVTG